MISKEFLMRMCEGGITSLEVKCGMLKALNARRHTYHTIKVISSCNQLSQHYFRKKWSRLAFQQQREAMCCGKTGDCSNQFLLSVRSCTEKSNLLHNKQSIDVHSQPLTCAQTHCCSPVQWAFLVVRSIQRCLGSSQASRTFVCHLDCVLNGKFEGEPSAPSDVLNSLDRGSRNYILLHLAQTSPRPSC